MIQRLLQGLLVVLAVISLTFLMVRLSPGSPFAKERELPEEVRVSLERLYGLDQPLWVQLGRHIRSFVTLDWPMSYRLKGWSVGEIVAQGLPVSLMVGGGAFLLAIGVGIPLGAMAALHAQRWQDRWIVFWSTLGICTPSLVLGPLLALWLGMRWKWFNPSGWYDATDWVLPTLTLGLLAAASVARLTRAGMLETLSMDHIRTARAKGVGSVALIMRHVLALACLPVLNYLGPLGAALLSGSFVTETVFDLPGLGRHFVSSAVHDDYTLAMALAALFAVLIVLFNLVVDLIQTWVDPRIRSQIQGR